MTGKIAAALLAFLSLPAVATDLLVTNATVWTDAGPLPRREILIRDGHVARRHFVNEGRWAAAAPDGA